LGLVEALRLASRIGILPECVRIFAIEAHDIAPGRPPSPAAERGLEAAVAAILREIETSSVSRVEGDRDGSLKPAERETRQ
jgi:hypothetical protein